MTKKHLIVLGSLVLLAVVFADCRPVVPLLRIIPLHPKARSTVVQFQSALRNQDWEQALTFCSESVKTAAREYASSEEFFRDVVPVEQILGLHRLETHVARYRGIKRLNVSVYHWTVPVATGESEPDFIQRYEVVKSKDCWEINLPCEPLDQWLEETRKRRELALRELRQMGEKMLPAQAREHVGPTRTTESFRERQRDLWFEHHKDRLQESTRCKDRLERLIPKLGCIRVELKAMSECFRIGEPMPFTLELVNEGDSALYYKYVTISGSLTILDDHDYIVTYCADAQYPTDTEFKRIEANQSVVLCDNYDISRDYGIDRTGCYKVEFNGVGLAVGDKFDDDSGMDVFCGEIDFISNTVEIKAIH
jgi:hypothetical protein